MSQTKKKQKNKPDDQTPNLMDNPISEPVETETTPKDIVEDPEQIGNGANPVESAETQSVDPATRIQEVVENDPAPVSAGEPISGSPVDILGKSPEAQPSTPTNDEIPPNKPNKTSPLPVRPHQTSFSRGAVVGLVVATNFMTLVLALVITLGILANLNNGNLQFAAPGDLETLAKRVNAVEADMSNIASEIAAVRTRLGNLESMSGRLTELEKQGSNMSIELERNATEIQILSTQAVSLTTQVDNLSSQVIDLENEVIDLQTRSSKYQQFLDGLSDLLKTILPEGNSP